MIRLRRPAKPGDFERQVFDARVKVQRTFEEASEKNQRLGEKDFNAYWWRKFKPHFETENPPYRKCMYCEGDPTSCASLEMEHYRPKTAVSSLTAPCQPLPQTVSKPQDRGAASTVSEHGYWWLAYAWDNWLLACERCNGHYKGTLFPRAGSSNLAVVLGCDADERPLLLNPFDDEPAEHLDFDDDGFVYELSSRGAETIRTCGLHRDGLQRARSVLAGEVGELLEDYQYAPTLHARDETLAKLRRLGARQNPFAGMVRALVWRCLGMERDERLFDSIEG